MRACKSVRRVVSGATALMLAVCMVMCMSMCTFASFVISSFAVTMPAFATDADRSYASWSDVSKAIDSQLQQGQSEYKSGNNSGAATRFQAAYNSVYVASNMITVVRDTFGQNKVQSQSDQFQQLQTLVYQQNQGDQIAAVSKALSADVAQTAAQLDSNSKIDKPNIYAQKLRAQIKAERKKLDAAKKEKSWAQRPYLEPSCSRNERYSRQIRCNLQIRKRKQVSSCNSS